MTSNGMTSTHFALLDYDGFVCKAFFAAMARGEINDAENVLLELTNIAIQKAKDFFESEDVEVFKFMSGHSWKKDLYPEYKDFPISAYVHHDGKVYSVFITRPMQLK